MSERPSDMLKDMIRREAMAGHALGVQQCVKLGEESLSEMRTRGATADQTMGLEVFLSALKHFEKTTADRIGDDTPRPPCGRIGGQDDPARPIPARVDLPRLLASSVFRAG